MLIIIGYFVVIASVLGGFALAGGHLAALLQPLELLMIGGASVGAFIVGNSIKAIKATLKALPTLFQGSRYTKALYMELMSLLYEILAKVRKEGLMSIEGDVDNPEESPIFTKYPTILKDHHAVEFLTDYLRLMVGGNLNAFEIENLMDNEIETHHHEGSIPAQVVAKVGDGMPAFGIVEVDDVIQAGMMGLLDAVNRYQESLGAQFETYASQRIRGAILDELRSCDWVPRSVRKNMRRIEAAVNELEQKLKRTPTEQELATHLKASLAEYQQWLQDARGYQLVYYEDFQETDDDRFLDRHAASSHPDPADVLEEEGMRELLVAAIDSLPEREKLMMSLYYEKDLNLREIGEVLGVSESRVCQLHTQAIARLRAKMRNA